MKLSSCLSALLPACLLALFSTACNSTGSYQSHATGQESLIAVNTARSFRYEGPLRNPVIVIHGIFGSRLTDFNTGNEVWGVVRDDDLSGAELRALSIPMAKEKKLSALGNRTLATAPLHTVRSELFGFPVTLQGYNELSKILSKAGYYSVGQELNKDHQYYTQYFFTYDWRRSIPENAMLLHEFIIKTRASLQKTYEAHYGLKDYPIHFDLVAHDMGGLIGRYYLMYGAQNLPEDKSKLPVINRAGEEYVDKLIQIGTANAGYLDALLELTEGLQLQVGAPDYSPALIGTFPSYYQLLPFEILKCVREKNNNVVDIYDPEIWKKNGWGLAGDSLEMRHDLKVLMPNVKDAAERRAIAYDHLKKCLAEAHQFSLAMSAVDNIDKPHDSAIILFYGDSLKTNTFAMIDKNGGIHTGKPDCGDGKVPAVSARMDRRDPLADSWSPFLSTSVPWNAIFTIRAAHMGITHSDDFANNVRLILLQIPTPRQRAAELKLLAAEKNAAQAAK